jgi:hypothetical protein
MIFTVIGLAVIIIGTYQAYKTAKGNGRNALLWGITTFLVGFGIQWILPMVIGFVLAIVWIIGGSNPESIREQIVGPAQVIGVLCLIGSFAGIWLMLKMVSRLPDEPIVTGPPPPPDFQ